MNKTNAYIQWKGTDVCMDVLCKCGKRFHIDGMFAYFVKCPHCQSVYKVGESVSLELSEIPTCKPLLGESDG